MLFLLALLFAALTFLFILIMVTYAKRRQSTDIFHRLRRHTSEEIIREKDKGFLIKAYESIQRVAQPLTKFSLTQLPEKTLQKAGLPILGAEFLIIEFIVGVFAGVIAYMLTLNRQLAFIGFLAAPTIIWMMILMRIGRRRTAFTEQLGDCLTTVANALRAGYSFQQAMDIIAKEMEPPISSEFARVTQDISMGINLEESLEQMARRVESSDFDLVVTAVLIQREIGGNLAQVLDSISDTIAERIRMKREINSLTAQGRLSAMVLLALPFAAGAFMFLFNHDNFMLIFDEPMGQIAMAGAIVLDIIGIFVIKRIVDIEV